MWVKKSEHRIREEIQNEKTEYQKNRLINAFRAGMWVFVIAFFGEILLSITVGLSFFSRIPEPNEVIKVNELPDYFPFFLKASLLLAGVFVLIRFVSPRMFKDRPTSSMCDKCFRVKSFTAELDCECGGRFLPIYHFEWVEAPEDYLVDNMDWIYEYKVEK